MDHGHPLQLPPWLTVTAAPPTTTAAPPTTTAVPPTVTVARPGAARLEGARAVVLAAGAARTRVTLFGALVRLLDLPGYVGRNWDALAESLRDRLDAGPLILVVDDATQLLADEPVGHLGLLLTLLGDAARDAPHPLRVVLRAAPDRVAALRRRTTAALPRR
ncbi:barstar family protein [Micromonospora sp. DT233]|uniref:barstar family protein n=1 Tax=Micromonospora sp. DT233 TaxID=3393432 RepID=UPI003CE7A2CD